MHMQQLIKWILGLMLVTASLVGVAGAGAADAVDNQDKVLAKAWWNDDKKTENLALSAEQRTKMDGYLRAYLSETSELRTQRQAAMSALGEALARGDQAAAIVQRDEMGRLMSQPVTQQIDMMIAVAGLLTEAQRQTLVAQSPDIFSRFWVRQPNSGKGRRARPKANTGVIKSGK